jgi:hypothetical protein
MSGCRCSSCGGASSASGGSSTGGRMDPYFVAEVRNDPAASYNQTAVPDRARIDCTCSH